MRILPQVRIAPRSGGAPRIERSCEVDHHRHGARKGVATWQSRMTSTGAATPIRILSASSIPSFARMFSRDRRRYINAGFGNAQFAHNLIEVRVGAQSRSYPVSRPYASGRL